MTVITGTGGADDLTGTSGDDEIRGGAGGDTIGGGDGADTLDGGPGADIVSGGAGQDRFLVGTGESGPAPESLDIIEDWQSGDSLGFSGPAATPSSYIEATASTYAAALGVANAQVQAGAFDFLAIQVGADVVVFADSRNDNGVVDDAVMLRGRTLADIAFTNLLQSGPATPAPTPGVGGAQGTVSGDMDRFQLSGLFGAEITAATPSQLQLVGSPDRLTLGGFGFAYDDEDQLVGGILSSIAYQSTSFSANLVTQNLSAAPFLVWVLTNATLTALSTILVGNDRLGGSAGGDLIRGFTGHDLIYGRGGQDSLYGGAGDDSIYASLAPGTDGAQGVGGTYLRGDEGDDQIVGGASFDDINGNMGNDTGSGGLGDDWVVGGKDNDSLSGDAGSDLVYGNLGADTCEGGAGNDIVRGGQENDIVSGGDGDDYVSGDKGADTVTGGAGADLFHTFGDAGIDRVTDFSLAQGDRVQLDPGTVYEVAQVGSDTVINMTGGGQMILVGVQLASLTPGWIFGA